MRCNGWLLMLAPMLVCTLGILLDTSGATGLQEVSAPEAAGIVGGGTSCGEVVFDSCEWCIFCFFVLACEDGNSGFRYTWRSGAEKPIGDPVCLADMEVGCWDLTDSKEACDLGTGDPQ